MEGVQGVCKECGEEFFIDSENCGTDESLCEECFNMLQKEENINPKRKWLFNAEDENGDSHYLQDSFFIGTYEEATHFANISADEWENKIGGLIMKLVIESHGKI